MPHGGELRCPEHIRQCLHHLHPARLRHGDRAAEDPRLLEELARRQVALEVCPTSNVSLGVYQTLEEIPVRDLMAGGLNVALGADDPLLFGTRLAGQYAVLRAAQDFTDAELAELARMSLRASCAPEEIKRSAMSEINRWADQEKR